MILIGIIGLLFIAYGIIMLRRTLKQSGGPVIGAYMKIYDIYSIIRFTGALFMVGIFLVLALLFSNKR